MKTSIFDNLFVLNMAGNHRGDLSRGIKIITDLAKVAHYNNAHSALKFCFRDINSLIHKDFRHRTDISLIKRFRDTPLSWDDYQTMVTVTHNLNMTSVAMPFDDFSVEKCAELGIQIIEIPTSNIIDWSLIKKIATIKKPILITTQNCSLLDLDDVVSFFCDRDIPLCINHCIGFRPSDDCDFELNQIDFLKTRYPKNVIGFGMHQHKNWHDSVLIAYGKGARVFERLVDIKVDGIPTSRHCSLPEEVDAWFKIIIGAEKMCGSAGDTQHMVFKKNQDHIDDFVRGVYAKHDLPAGHILTDECVYLALPLQKGQISCREMMNGETILQAVQKDGVIAFCNVNTPYKADSTLAKMIEQRGIDQKPTVATRGILRLI